MMSYKRMIQRIRVENLHAPKELYRIFMENQELCARLRLRHWRSKAVLVAVAELEKTNREIYEKENRSGIPTSNLQWRKKGFRKQTIFS